MSNIEQHLRFCVSFIYLLKMKKELDKDKYVMQILIFMVKILIVMIKIPIVLIKIPIFVTDFAIKV